MYVFTKTKHVMLAIGLVLIFSPNLHGADLSSNLGVIEPDVRVEAPAFTLSSLKGDPASISDFNGKTILLHFWATWCAPCKEEMPSMQRFWKKSHKENFVIIAVAVDRGRPATVRRFIKKHGITFPVLLDPKGKARQAYYVSALPFSYIIGSDKKIIGKIVGARDWDGPKSMVFFKNVLNR